MALVEAAMSGAGRVQCTRVDPDRRRSSSSSCDQGGALFFVRDGQSRLHKHGSNVCFTASCSQSAFQRCTQKGWMGC